jgi:hypothetical protein
LWRVAYRGLLRKSRSFELRVGVTASRREADWPKD